MKNFCVVWPFRGEKHLLSIQRLFNLNEMTESECLSEFRFGKRDILIHVIAVFHIKFISSILWFSLPKYVQVNFLLTSSLARLSQLLSFFEVKTIHYSTLLVEFSINIACYEKKETKPGFTRMRKNKGLQKSLKTVDLYLPKLVDCRTTWFYFVWRRRRHHDDEIYWSHLRSTL